MNIRGIEVDTAEGICQKPSVCISTIGNEEFLRQAMRKIFSTAQRHKDGVCAVGVSGCSAGLPVSAYSRIIAQETWRYSRQAAKPAIKKIIYVVTGKHFAQFKKIFEGYLDHVVNGLCQGPFVTVDGIVAYRGGIVLIKRKNPPFGWALPGGFLDYGETVEYAAVREVKEETNLDFKNIQLFKVCSDPRRDPRFQTVTVIFAGKGFGVLKASDDAADAGVFTEGKLPEKIAFDHRDIVIGYLRAARRFRA